MRVPRGDGPTIAAREHDSRRAPSEVAPQMALKRRRQEHALDPAALRSAQQRLSPIEVEVGGVERQGGTEANTGREQQVEQRVVPTGGFAPNGRDGPPPPRVSPRPA